MEELQAKHRKEQRDLQARITQKKKSATKKTRKGVNDECANLERELKERQERELANLNDLDQINDSLAGPKDAGDESGPVEDTPSEPTSSLNGVQSSLETLSIASQRTPAPPTGQASTEERKPNRQKARLARRAAEQDAIAAKAAEEAANLPNLRERERARMVEEFKKHGLQEKEIRADGHCLYSAFADQIGQLGLGLRPGDNPSIAVAGNDATNGEPPDYRVVRQAAAGYIVENSDDFVPFLEEPLDEYVHKVRDTGEWGGQLELLALAKTYGVTINVLQGDGRVEKIESGTGTDGKNVWLAYYRHGFGLGEHYNSLRKAP